MQAYILQREREMMDREKEIYRPDFVPNPTGPKTAFSVGVVGEGKRREIRFTVCDQWINLDRDMATDALLALAATLGFAVVNKNLLENVEKRLVAQW
jgi:hypothetical protein